MNSLINHHFSVITGSLDLDTHERERDRGDLHSQKENRYVTGQAVIKTEKKTERKNSHEKAGTSGFLVPYTSGSTTPTLAYSLGHMGAGGNAIAAAASQAIAATQQVCFRLTSIWYQLER